MTSHTVPTQNKARAALCLVHECTAGSMERAMPEQRFDLSKLCKARAGKDPHGAQGMWMCKCCECMSYMCHLGGAISGAPGAFGEKGRIAQEFWIVALELFSCRCSRRRYVPQIDSAHL